VESRETLSNVSFSGIKSPSHFFLAYDDDFFPLGVTRGERDRRV